MAHEGTDRKRILITATAGCVRGFDRDTGQCVWEVKIGRGDSLGIELIVQEGFVLASGPTSESLYCIDYETGNVIGQIKVGVGRKTVIVDGDQIFVDRNRSVHCFTLRGELIWEDRREEGLVGCMALGFPGNVRQADQGS